MTIKSIEYERKTYETCKIIKYLWAILRKMETYNKMLENMDPRHQAKPRRWPFCGIWSTSPHVRWGGRLVLQAPVAIYMRTSVDLSIKWTVSDVDEAPQGHG